MVRAFVRRHPVVLLSVLSVALTFAAYLLPLPPVALQLLMAFVPAVVAISLAALGGGRTEVRSLLSCLVAWRVNRKWLAVALALALALRLAMTGTALLRGLIPTAGLTSSSSVQWILLAVIFVVAATPEELAWRGYALAQSLAGHPPALAAFLVGLPWGLLHVALHLPGMPNEGLPLLPTILHLPLWESLFSRDKRAR